MKRERLKLTDRQGLEATYIEQPGNKYKKLKEFCGTISEQFSGSRYYWVIGMGPGGDWYRGGYYISEFIHNHVNLFYDRYEDKVYKQTDVSVQIF